MSQCYGPLAARYDALTGDVPYEALETWYETAFAHSGRAVHTVLDLCCGTGTLSLLLAKHGYEMICVDASAEMLSVFQQKLRGLPRSAVAPMLLCQRAEELDLYDTVDAAVCSLDGVNYMRPETLPEVFRRLHLFLSPGGTLCFDFLSPGHMRSLDGQCFVDEEDDTLCLWRSEVVKTSCATAWTFSAAQRTEPTAASRRSIRSISIRRKCSKSSLSMQASAASACSRTARSTARGGCSSPPSA